LLLLQLQARHCLAGLRATGIVYCCLQPKRRLAGRQLAGGAILALLYTDGGLDCMRCICAGSLLLGSAGDRDPCLLLLRLLRLMSLSNASLRCWHAWQQGQ
jgi:hypothetical protein